jgi:hypothetical protein
MRAALLPALLLLAACDRLPVGLGNQMGDYNPEEAGTVDHALCLLGFTGVPMRELASGHHIVEVTLNGRPGTFVLDTGANTTVLHTAYADEFGLAEGGRVGGAIGIGGALQARQVGVDSFAIGHVPVRLRRIMVTDLGQIATMLAPMAGDSVHGIVGQDVMKEHRTVIDVSRSLVHLIEEDRDPAPVPAEECRTDASGQGGSEDRPRPAAPP